MSNSTKRRLYDIAIEPSAASLLSSHLQSSSNHSDSTSQSLPNYFALNFNFKPDSTQDCKKGALFQPGPSRSQNAEWHFELESNEHDTDANGESGGKKPAHVFTGPQTAAKAYDLVLVWDAAAKVYRLDRVAATFALKYERSKTVLSLQNHDVWESEAVKPKKRPVQDSSMQRRTTPSSVERDYSSLTEDSRAGSSGRNRQGELKLRGKTSTVMAPVRRSSRRNIAVEMEEFDDQPESSIGPSAASANDDRSKRSSAIQETSSNKGVVHGTKEPATKHSLAPEPPQGSTSGLRRSRSSQAQGETSSSSPQQPPTPTITDSQTTATGAASVPEGSEGEDDDLALELERELEREIEIEMEDISQHEAPTDTEARSASTRTLSPASRLDANDKQVKISTPKAHTPDAEDFVASRRPSALSNEVRRSPSPLTHKQSDCRSAVPASIGLGLQQTDVGITPTASPHLDVASPRSTSQATEDAPREDEEDDDDLDGFAAELDMSLAEIPDASPVIALAPVVEKRKSSRPYTAAQNSGDSRQVRKAYGLGGPRQEEEELEDSD
ncbi:hypothetical protein NDA11_000960 [Ustilago hordei]|uniref:Transcription elongation factor Eaf N-terminal domain-containing protein n=1 Tax=Ustilago hordei TaxID=120017 RepID=I2G273_USTHO|nr:uncharacterized protein UHO2_02575 [Ustilago hordei]KAJ1040246.1 hypothetical protein NDA10_006480 [Ustilago hordei]KAJ1585431.1 hypothetical protein NDA15_006154 [Ustilago hordei]KAJ1588247.1 hypothetical protein NDA12_005411 [Ustilago hordei]KAJ1592713.1 hypothetical protein NDA11_000960 [Ustilago hordei]KAJ1601308.1 hypothetical protein NDA14_001190 [Ustilago hordei]